MEDDIRAEYDFSKGVKNPYLAMLRNTAADASCTKAQSKGAPRIERKEKPYEVKRGNLANQYACLATQID